MDSFYERAYALVSSAEARGAFDMKAEPDAIKDEYGRNQAGQRMLLARRLVEAGVRFVTLSYGGWDMHSGIANGMNRTLPKFDQAYSALINDLDRRGMLDKTLVMVSSEFGRTPKINKDAGRDHWPQAQSILLAGGGYRHGQVIGSTNDKAEYPTSRKIGVEDFCAIVYHSMGLKIDDTITDLTGRPTHLVPGGEVPLELL